MISSLLAGQHWIAWTFTKLQTCVSDKLISLIALISQLFAVETLHSTFHHCTIPSLHSALQRALCSARGCESRSHRVSMTKSHGLAETHRSELGGFVDNPVGYLVWICLNLTCNVNIEYHFHGHSLAQWRWINMNHVILDVPCEVLSCGTPSLCHGPKVAWLNSYMTEFTLKIFSLEEETARDVDLPLPIPRRVRYQFSKLKLHVNSIS